MIKTAPAGALLLLLLLAGCDGDANDPRRQPRPTPIPRALCSKVEDSLKALRDKGAMDYEDSGEAVVEEPLWFSMGGPGRDQLAQALAYHAACRLPEGAAEQQVVVRNGAGMVLMRRTVNTSINLREVLGADGGEALAK